MLGSIPNGAGPMMEWGVLFSGSAITTCLPLHRPVRTQLPGLV